MTSILFLNFRTKHIEPHSNRVAIACKRETGLTWQRTFTVTRPLWKCSRGFGGTGILISKKNRHPIYNNMSPLEKVRALSN